MSAHDEHSSFIKTPQQLVVVVVLAFVVPISIILLLVSLVLNEAKVDPAALTPAAVAERLQPVGRVEFGAASGAGGGAAVARSGEEIFKATCAACNETGAAGAPKVGDNAAWATRVKEPFAKLLKDAINGIRAMPPRGGNPDLSDQDMARAVAYMANRSGGRYPEPAAPAVEKK
jgi:cytochrome c5